MGRVSRRTPVTRWDTAARQSTRRPDAVAVEEPLEIRVDGSPVTVTMRTPGHDVDLALGFLLGEGLIADVDDVRTAVHCNDVGTDGRPTFNVLEVTLREGVPAPDLTGRRNFGMTSACGVCGSASIDAVRARTGADLSPDRTQVEAEVLVDLPRRLREAQPVFDRTGGLHAAGLFTAQGTLLAVREDVGRHNATDKLLGTAARERGWPLTGTVLVLSGRTSFELVQKAWAAGVPLVAAVSAPSSLAVELAQEAGLTLVGFVRPPHLNCYSHPERIVLATRSASPTG